MPIYRKSTSPKTAKTSHVGMHFHQNNTFPKINETSDNAHHNTYTDYPPITAQCIYRVATIPTSFQPHPPQYVAHPHTQLHTQYLLQHTQLFILITINQDTLSPSNNHPYIFIHNHYILHKTQHPTLSQEHYSYQNALHSTNPALTSTNQAEQFLTTPHCYQ